MYVSVNWSRVRRQSSMCCVNCWFGCSVAATKRISSVVEWSIASVSECDSELHYWRTCAVGRPCSADCCTAAILYWLGDGMLSSVCQPCHPGSCQALWPLFS